MLKWPWKLSKPARSVKLDIINAIELKPEANYILLVDSKHFKREELQLIMKDLKRVGVRNVVSFMLQGSPDESIQLISKEKLHAAKPSRRKHA